MYDQDTYSHTRDPAGSAGGYTGTGAHEATDTGSKAAVAADTARETAKDEARNVASTAKQEAGAVVGEARSQVRRLASQARDQATDRVRGQHSQLVDRLRGLADEFQQMSGDGDSPGKALVSDLGQRGRRVADYLADRGPEGLMSEVTDFARRRPLAFLATAVAAGFVVGRLGKGVWKAQSESDSAAASYSTATYATGTYPTETYSTDTYPTGPTGTYPTDTYPAETYATGTYATSSYQPESFAETAPVATEPAVAEPYGTDTTVDTGYGTQQATGVAGAPQWTEPPPSTSAPVTPAVPPQPMQAPATEPFTPSPYASESYDDPYRNDPRGGEQR